mgnify:CR=1 FL=1
MNVPRERPPSLSRTVVMPNTPNPASGSTAAPAAAMPAGFLQPQRVLGESASGTTWLAYQLTALEGGAISIKRTNARFTKYVMGEPSALELLAAFQGRSMVGLPTLLRAGITRDELVLLMEGNDGESLDLVTPPKGFALDVGCRLVAQLAGAVAAVAGS